MTDRKPYVLLLVASLTLSAAPALAKVEPAHAFSDHMVLQRGKLVPVWGWADKGETHTEKAMP